MIAHVAEAGEDRGRVVVRLGEFAVSSPAAVSAAIHVATAFRSQLEGLFIEDPDLYHACAHANLRELSMTGAAARLSPARLGRDAEAFAVAVQRQLSNAAHAAGIGFTARVVRDPALKALQDACAERGPWNIIAFAEPIAGRAQGEFVSNAIAEIWGTTGYIATGARAVWRPGPIIVAIEDVEHLTGMIRAAERLAAVSGDRIELIPVGGDEIGLDWLEGEIRLTLGEGSSVNVLPRPSHAGSNLVLRSAIAERKPRMVIARHGGFLLSAGELAKPLSDLGCPVFLVH